MLKKGIALLLCLLLLVGMAVPAFSADDGKLDFPVILITGDSMPIVDKDDNQIFQIKQLGKLLGDDDDEEEKDRANTITSVVNVLKPFLIDGLLRDNWDPYYENLQKEIGDLFGDVALDENGDPKNGTGIPHSRIEANEENMHSTEADNHQFYYDWRKDPMEIADELNVYIDTMLESTGKEKINIVAACLGVSAVYAYIAKYGSEKLHGLAIKAAIANGSEFISESISGNFKLDGNALVRLLTDTNATGYLDIDEFAIQSVDLMTKLGVLDAAVGWTREKLYDKLAEGVTSALALGTFFTMPCYWTAVKAEDYETAKNYVFGKEGSEKRVKYAGLIQKLDDYDTVVRRHMTEIMLRLHEQGINLAVLAKYGFQMVPICKSRDVVSDQYVSVTSASFGATTSTIYDTLSDDYIARRVAEGKGKYISPDHLIDASTCLFPDFTWFEKNSSHSHTTSMENDLMYSIVEADHQLTVDDFAYTQFMVYNKEANTLSAMTTENCHTENWVADREAENPSSPFAKLRMRITAIVDWLRALFALLKTKIAEK